MMEFYLGAHMPSWLRKVRAVSLFISHLRLAGRRSYRPATTGWALDSGGFTQIAQHGRFTTSPAEYVAAVDRYDREIGRLQWAAPQDWMCEPSMLARTGLTIAEHQLRTVENFIHLTELWEKQQALQKRNIDMNSCPFMPVLQGWRLDDYWRCVDMYYDNGVDLEEWLADPVQEDAIIGVGSVCRRQSTDEIGEIFLDLSRYFPLHGFGVKTEGLAKYGQYLESADSMAWSFRGRHLPGCDDSHGSEANCLSFALGWRTGLLEKTPLVSI